MSHLHRVPSIEARAQSSLLRSNPRLDHALSNSTAKGLPAITVSPLQGQLLAIQCKLMGAKSVLEVGTLGGYSTIWFASTGASVTSIEINPQHRDVAIQNTQGLDVEVILGAALDVLPKLKEEGRVFDFVFIDASWGEQFQYFEWATKLVRQGGAVYVDNVVRELLESGVDKGGDLVEKAGNLEGVQATLVSTASGHKGREDEMIDGFLLAIVGGKE